MPTIVEEGEYKFIVHTHELPYEPPHVHVRFGGEEVRINLDSGVFMEPPPGGRRGNIMGIYERNVATIRKEWDRIHQSQ